MEEAGVAVSENKLPDHNPYVASVVGLVLFIGYLGAHLLTGLWHRTAVLISTKVLPVEVVERILDEISVARAKVSTATAAHLPYEHRRIRAQRMAYEANAYIDELLHDEKPMDNPMKELNRQWRELYNS